MLGPINTQLTEAVYLLIMKVFVGSRIESENPVVERGGSFQLHMSYIIQHT